MENEKLQQQLEELKKVNEQLELSIGEKIKHSSEWAAECAKLKNDMLRLTQKYTDALAQLKKANDALAIANAKLIDTEKPKT